MSSNLRRENRALGRRAGNSPTPWPASGTDRARDPTPVAAHSSRSPVSSVLLIARRVLELAGRAQDLSSRQKPLLRWRPRSPDASSGQLLDHEQERAIRAAGHLTQRNLARAVARYVGIQYAAVQLLRDVAKRRGGQLRVNPTAVAGHPAASAR